MGQQTSKQHESATFGYINRNIQGRVENSEDNTVAVAAPFTTDRDRHLPDFVLNNPHLYKLESTCQHCSSNKEKVVIAEQTNTPCPHCRQNKRLSIVRRDLADDLSYIDETYYPNIVHYVEEDEGIVMDEISSDRSSDEHSSNSISGNEMPSDDIEDVIEEQYNSQEGWSKLTMREVVVATTPSASKRLVASSPSLAVDLSSKSLIRLSSSIGHLDNLTKLDLSDNQIISLPKAIGQLKSLRIFNASRNQLESIPDTFVLLKKLKAVNFSRNRLSSLPKGIGGLPSLSIIILDHNQLIKLPRELANLNSLITLNVSKNPLKSIPAEIATLKTLCKLLADDCPFVDTFEHKLSHNPPSLFELCARNIVKNNKTRQLSLQPSHFIDYFEREETCSFCYGPYFDSYVERGRFIERMGRQALALDYKLCSAHWTDENDRLFAMFSKPPLSSYSRKQPSSLAQDETVDTANTIPSINSSTDVVIQGEHHQQQQDYFNLNYSYAATSSGNNSNRRRNNYPSAQQHRSLPPTPITNLFDDDTMFAFIPSSPLTIVNNSSSLDRRLEQQHQPKKSSKTTNMNSNRGSGGSSGSSSSNSIDKLLPLAVVNKALPQRPKHDGHIAMRQRSVSASSLSSSSSPPNSLRINAMQYNTEHKNTSSLIFTQSTQQKQESDDSKIVAENSSSSSSSYNKKVILPPFTHLNNSSKQPENGVKTKER